MKLFSPAVTESQIVIEADHRLARQQIFSPSVNIQDKQRDTIQDCVLNSRPGIFLWKILHKQIWVNYLQICEDAVPVLQIPETLYVVLKQELRMRVLTEVNCGHKSFQLN